LIVISLVCHVLRLQLPSPIQGKATETATLLNALAAGLRAAVDDLEQFHRLPGQADHAVKDQQ